MAKKNPAHFRAEFEFHEDLVWITCSCGYSMQDEDIMGAFHKLKVHHANVAIANGDSKNIYKEAI